MRIINLFNIADCEYLSSDEKEIIKEACQMIHNLKRIVNQVTSTYRNDFSQYIKEAQKITKNNFSIFSTYHNLHHKSKIYKLLIT